MCYVHARKRVFASRSLVSTKDRILLWICIKKFPFLPVNIYRFEENFIFSIPSNFFFFFPLPSNYYQWIFLSFAKYKKSSFTSIKFLEKFLSFFPFFLFLSSRCWNIYIFFFSENIRDIRDLVWNLVYNRRSDDSSWKLWTRRRWTEERERGKKNNAGVFHCIGEVERVTNRIEVGQPRKIFQGKTGCKKGWKKAHSILPRLFNRRGNSYRPVQQLPSEILLSSLTRR